MTQSGASFEFDDGKAPDALRTIGEVSTALSIRQHVLRYWEEQFPMLRPVKRSGGRRYYRPEDIALIVTIDRLVHQEGFTLRGARKAIMARETALPAQHSGASEQNAVSGVPIEKLKKIRDDLAQALARA